MPSGPRRRHHYRSSSFVRWPRHCSSAAERLIRNQQVGGSNPSSGWPVGFAEFLRSMSRGRPRAPFVIGIE